MTKIEKRSKPKATQASIRGETYKLVSDEAKRRGITIAAMMEIILADAFKTESDTEEKPQKTVTDYRKILF